MRALLLRGAAVAMFLLCSQVIYGMLHPAQTEMSLDASTELSPTSTIVSFLIYALVCLSLLFYVRSLPAILLNAKAVLCLPLLALLSAAWSQDPSLTLRRASVLLVVSSIGACLGAIYTLQELSELVSITAFLICVATFLIGAVAPGIVRDTLSVGAWKGLFTHKNAQGMFMALGFISALHSRFERVRWFKYATLSLTGLLLLMSQSSTSLVAVLITLAVLPLWRLTRVPLKQAVPALAALALVIGLGVFIYEQYSVELFGALGKNSTLTGRTELWVLILQSISRQPILGYGYSAFWLGLRGESLAIIAASGWVVFHAHNGLLDVLLGLGFVGGALFLFTYLRMIGMMVTYVRATGAGMQDLWAASFLVLLTVINCTESVLLSANTIFWLLYVAVYANIARSVALSRVRQLSAHVVPGPAYIHPHLPDLSPER